ncbi:MAG: hypothetical protein FGM24_08780, partial [Candidatus Kapabacteria bacterium]|nr:hypothetical protein [Candidatus Kapabacteria bacterium]
MQKERDMDYRSMTDDMAARMTAYIDKALNEEERRQAEQDLASSPALQRQHAVESALVTTLRARRTQLRAPLPPQVERRIRMAVNAEAMPRPSVLERFAQPTGWRFWRLFAAGAAVAIVALVVYNGGTIDPQQASQQVATLPPIDLPQASYANYASITNGSLTLGKTSSNASELKSYFKDQGVSYDVLFPAVDATLKGGVVSEHDGKKFAHLVYECGGHTIYMFEVDQASIDTKYVDLGQRVADDIEHS